MSNINFILIKSAMLLWWQLGSCLEAAKIFAVSGVPHSGQNLFTSALLNTLHARGHDIIAVINFPHEIELHNGIEKIIIESNSEINKVLTSSVANLDETFYQNLKNYCSKSILAVKNIISHPKVQDILKHERFDLILLDTWMTDALSGLGEYFNAPIVGISNFPTNQLLDLLVGNISPISVIPAQLLQHRYEANFPQRCLNVTLKFISRMIYYILYMPLQKKLYKEIFPNATMSFDQANRNFSLVLINQHFSLHYPRPYVPNMIEVAGLHIEEKDESLSLEVQRFLNDSSTPIIYMRLPLGVANSTLLFHALKELNYKVIWHMYEAEKEDQIYSNILPVSNTSHFTVLAHPNVKLLVTNGDTQSIVEAAQYAKPILGIPVYSDHYINMKMAITGGYGLALSFKHLNEVNFKATVKELLWSPTYTYKVTQISKIFRDQQIRPRDKAIYWIEYILRHDGALHLRSKGRFLNFWQYHNVDVFAAYCAVFVVIVFLIWSIMKCLYMLIRRKGNNSEIKYEHN